MYCECCVFKFMYEYGVVLDFGFFVILEVEEVFEDVIEVMNCERFELGCCFVCYVVVFVVSWLLLL